MQLDRIGIRPRLRSSWEAIDLGFVMARQWYRPLLLSWLVPSLILFTLLSALLPDDWWWLTNMVVWWLKPIWDSAPLYIASRALFGETVTPLQAWRRVPRLLGTEALAWLTWRRFSFTRSTDLPLTLLEQLRGQARAQRLGLLHRSIGNGAGWLTVVCVHLEGAIVSGLVLLGFLMLPEELRFDPMEFIDQHGAVVEYGTNLISCLAMALVAPFYTMAGFALYLSRRVELEGWDIEIRFRHLAAVTRSRSRGNGITALLLCIGLLAAAPFAASPAAAQGIAANHSLETDAPGAQQRIDAVLAGPEFHQKVTMYDWRFKDAEEGDGSIPEWLILTVIWLENSLGEMKPPKWELTNAAAVIRFALWVVLISLFIYLLYRYRDGLRLWLRLARPAAAPQRPEMLFGLDVRAQSLPADVLGEVLVLWRAQQQRAALSLLYRATLTQLLERFALPFHDDHTEGECAAIARAAAPAAVADFFGELTGVWQRLAYAHRDPSTEQLEALCARWREVFAHG